MSATSGRARRAIGAMVTRGQVRVTWAESLAVLVTGSLVAFFRLGDAPARGVIWAEDGMVFLQTAHQGSLLSDILTPYAGYANVAPRTVAAVVTLLPLSWQGFAVDASAALVQAGVGLLVFLVVVAHTGHRITGLLATAVVVAVPVGTEVVVSVANLHWFLLTGALLAALWVPRTSSGRAATVVLVLFATTSGPFAAALLPATAVLWWASRERHLRDLTVAAGVGLVLQWWVILHAEDRPRPAVDPSPARIGEQWFARVLGDGVLGVARHDGQPAPSTTAGLLIGLALVLLAIWTARRHGWSSLLVPAYLLALGVVVYVPAVYITAVDVTNPSLAGRYYVAPVLLTMCGLLLVVDRVVADAVASREPAFARIVPSALAVGMTACLCYGLASTWWIEDGGARAQVPSWGEEVAAARHECRDLGPRGTVRLETAPAGWGVELPCQELR